MNAAPEITLSLATEQNDHLSRFKALLSDTDGFLRHVNVPKASDMSFEVDGVTYHTRLIPHQNGEKIVIWAELGILPYSVVDSAKRKNLITILEGARYLPTIKLGVDQHMRILVKGTYSVNHPPAPDYFFVPLIKLLQEVRPFLPLISENL